MGGTVTKTTDQALQLSCLSAAAPRGWLRGTRAGRNTVPMRPVRVVLPLTLAGSLLAPVLAGAKYQPPQPKDAAAARRIAMEQKVTDLVNKANRRISAKNAACVPHSPFEDRKAPTEDTPSQAALDALAPMRRPAGPGDVIPGSRSEDLFVGQVYTNFVRTVTAADGSRFTVLIARLDAPVGPPQRCRTAARAELVRLLKGEPKGLRTRALRLQSHAGRVPAGPSGPQDGIFLFSRRGDALTSGGGGGDVRSFLARGAFNSAGGGRSARLNGLLPDGVATVTISYPKRVSRGRNYKTKVYPSAFTRTVEVQENVVSLRVPRGADDAFPARMVWRNKAGAVVRVVKQP